MYYICFVLNPGKKPDWMCMKKLFPFFGGFKPTINKHTYGCEWFPCLFIWCFLVFTTVKVIVKKKYNWNTVYIVPLIENYRQCNIKLFYQENIHTILTFRFISINIKAISGIIILFILLQITKLVFSIMLLFLRFVVFNKILIVSFLVAMFTPMSSSWPY